MLLTMDGEPQCYSEVVQVDDSHGRREEFSLEERDLVFNRITNRKEGFTK